MKSLLRALVSCILIVWTPTITSALVCDDPGPAFNIPATCDGYQWSLSLDNMNAGEDLLSFTVTVTDGGTVLPVFQVFGFVEDSSTGIGPLPAYFDLFLDDIATPWTEVSPEVYYYHNLFNQPLPAGPTEFRVVFGGFENALDGPSFADIRFGNVVVAIPVPASLTSLLAGIALLSGLGAARRCRFQQPQCARPHPPIRSAWQSRLGQRRHFDQSQQCAAYSWRAP